MSKAFESIVKDQCGQKLDKFEAKIKCLPLQSTIFYPISIISYSLDRLHNYNIIIWYVPEFQECKHIYYDNRLSLNDIEKNYKTKGLMQVLEENNYFTFKMNLPVAQTQNNATDKYSVIFLS